MESRVTLTPEQREEIEAQRAQHAPTGRATDETGRTQPLEPSWNAGGYANNEVQRIRVVAQADRD